jgi:prephenate dehydrogenase
LALIGAGLIGGSFALSLRQCYPALQVRVYDRDPGHAAAAVALGIAHQAGATVAEAVRGARLVVVAVPVGAMPAVFAELPACLASGATITDVGSTKGEVIAAARATLGTCFGRFVPGHPISGAEHSGPAAARAGLFQGKRVVLTPEVETEQAALAEVARWWKACGAQVHQLRAAQHDQIFAAVSHLPHLLSFALVDEFAGRPDAATLFDYAAGGFRDFTRIAASHPAMWRDIALANREALLGELDAYLAAVSRMRDQVATADGAGLFAAFERARAARVRWGARAEGAPAPVPPAADQPRRS